MFADAGLQIPEPLHVAAMPFVVGHGTLAEQVCVQTWNPLPAKSLQLHCAYCRCAGRMLRRYRRPPGPSGAAAEWKGAYTS